MNKITKRLSITICIFFIFTIVLGFLIFFLFTNFLDDAPNYNRLNTYRPASITRLYDSKGQVLDEYANEKRIYVKYENIPKIIINAFITVEDKNFFDHQGVDITSIIRAFIQNILNITKNKRLVGGSTITQQVVKGFFFNNERSLRRKLKEVILAFRINKVLKKKELLEIYLNQIYLGHHSYGVYVAAQNYFGKILTDINIEEAALLASLPKAPSILNPYKNYDKALERRNWAIQRMQEEKFITFEEKINAIKTPIKLSYSPIRNNKYENYYTNIIKMELIDLFNIDNVYNQAYIVNTNIDLKLQDAAEQALRKGLQKYDKKNGWRGVFAKIDLKQKNINKNLNKIARNNYHYNYQLGVITKINNELLNITLTDNTTIQLNRSSYDWILKSTDSIKNQLKKLFKPGNVILIDGVKNKKYKIEQIPEINGAIVVIENRSGKILALVGGYDFKQSNFNRVTQAYRQPGSAFKTFVYLAAFEQGISPNALVLDEPLEIDLGYGLPTWKPKNYADKYYGLITLRTSFEKSRNLSTLRVLLGIGLDKLTEIAQRYLIYNSNIKSTYSIALGSFETTLLKITNAYASIANNGILKQPKLIDSVYNSRGELLYFPSDLFCNKWDITTDKYAKPKFGFLGKKITDEASNYQILSLLEGVVSRGSAKKAKNLHRVIAGKTGTTNNSLDTWFIGSTTDITVGVFVGYDIPRDMGKYTAGSNIPLPIFIDFFKKTNFIPNRSFSIPDSIQKTYVDINTGKIIETQDFIEGKKYLHEGFKKHTFNSIKEKFTPFVIKKDFSKLPTVPSTKFDLIPKYFQKKVESQIENIINEDQSSLTLP